jgi:hypothetical protein
VRTLSIGFGVEADTTLEYDETGQLVGAVTTITLSIPASDPDGDPLTYVGSASNGSIGGSGLTATWTRAIESEKPKPGEVVVTASDGKGGTASFTMKFQ